MNDKKYKYTLYIITTVILCTIVIQGYWNYKNYVFNKQQLIKDIQVSLDKAVDDYYSELAQKTTLGFKFEGDAQKDAFKAGGFFNKVTASIDEDSKAFKDLRALKVDSIKGITVFRGLRADSLMNEDKEKHFPKIESKGIQKWLKKDKQAYDVYTNLITTIKEQDGEQNSFSIVRLTRNFFLNCNMERIRFFNLLPHPDSHDH